MKTSSSVFILGALLSGCVTVPKKSMQIEILKSRNSLPSGCAQLNDVGTFSMWGADQAMGRLRNDAAYAGATHLVLVEEVHSFWGDGFTAEAFECGLTL